MVLGRVSVSSVLALGVGHKLSTRTRYGVDTRHRHACCWR